MSFLLTVLRSDGQGEGVEIIPGVYLDADDLRRTPTGIHLSVAGSGRVGEQFVGHAGDLNMNVLYPGAGSTPQELMDSMAGSIALAFHLPGSDFVHVVPDPLGGQPVFRLGTAGDPAVLIGSDAARVVAAARRLEVPVDHSGTHISELILTGNAGFGGLSYTQLDVLPQFSTARITREGIDVIQHSRPWENSAEHEVALDSDDYWEAVEEIADDLRRNICAVAEYPAVARVAHLTGGFDSRLVLAGIMDRQCTDDFGFFCSGAPTQTDKSISLGLERTLGLRSAERSGIAVSRFPGSLKDEVLWPMVESGGLRTDGPSEHTYAFDTVVLSGGYGEILRSFYSRVGIPSVPDAVGNLCRTIWGSAATDPAHPSCFLTPAAIAAHNESVRTILISAASEEVREDYLLDRMYVSVRNRFYVGLSSALYSKYVHRFDPLYSVAAVRLASRLPVDVRQENFVGLDVMARTAPSLLTYDFDTPRISERYRRLRVIDAPRAFASAAGAVRRSYPVPYRAPRHRPVTYAPRPTAVQIDRANAMKASLRHVVLVDRVRTELAQLADRLGHTEVADYVDFGKLRRATLQAPADRVVMRSMFTCYSALTWFAQSRDEIS